MTRAPRKTLLLALLIPGFPALASSPQFDVQAIPVPPGSTADTPVVISADGAVLGGYSFIGDSSHASGIYEPALWQGTQAQILPVPAGDGGRVRGINGSTAVGIVAAGSSQDQLSPAEWAGGQLQLLDTLGLPGGYAMDINSSGTVAGVLTGPSGEQPVIWNGGVASKLGLPAGGTSGEVFGINNSGQVLVNAITGNVSTAWVWSNGMYTPIPSLSSSSQAGHGINSLGQVVGSGYLPNVEQPVGFLYSNGVTTALASFLGSYGDDPVAINEAGEIVGDWNGPLGDRAALWVGGQAYDLTTLLPANSGWTLESATDITPDGVIVGQGLFDGQQRGFELTPTASPSAATPEPASLAILTLGATTLLRRRRR